MPQNDVLNPEQQEDFILQQDISSVWVNDKEELIPPAYIYVGDPKEKYPYPEDIQDIRPVTPYYNYDNTTTSTDDVLHSFKDIDILDGDIVVGAILIVVIVSVLAIIMTMSSRYY